LVDEVLSHALVWTIYFMDTREEKQLVLFEWRKSWAILRDKRSGGYP
jgi:hypothetical protein